MNRKSITISYSEYNSNNELPTKDKELLDIAIEATKNSYAPYSRFNVGAAVRLANGEIISASNQENAAYPSGLCAERVAIFSASAQYPGETIECIAITINTDDKKVTSPVPPCGACRQVIAEYEHKQGKKIRVIFAGETGHIVQMEGIESLLPMTFNSNNLEHLK